MKKLLGLVAGFFALMAAAPASAATPVEVAYSGALGSSANVKAPFNAAGSGFTPSMAFSGTFYYDPDLIPASGTTNVFFSALTGIPATEAFTLDFGPLSFNLADNIDALGPAGIQYSNGQFNGFVFVSDFAFNGSYYQLRANGPTITVKLLDGVANAFDPHGFPVGTTSYINARFTTGNANLSEVVPTDLEGAVPEPATWAMMLLGFGAIGFLMRRKRAANSTYLPQVA
jgi:hypothetical protein